MMDNGPGISLFQPNEALQLNTSADRIEEEEALEDAKRRQEELQNLLTNAFDDLSDDDCHSTFSSQFEASIHNEGPVLEDLDKHSYSNSMTFHGKRPFQQLRDNANYSDNLCNIQVFPEKFVQNNEDKENVWHQNVTENNKDIANENQEAYFSQHPNHDLHHSFKQAENNSLEQLEVLYEVRLREVKRLTEQIEQEEKNASDYKDQMRRKLALCEAEKERAILSRTQANDLLIKSKGEITELQTEVASLQQKVSGLEKTNSELNKELSISRTMANELQQKLIMLERCDVKKNLEKDMDSMVKELKDKHQQEIYNMQCQLDQLSAKLSQKENDCSTLEKKVNEMQRAQEVLLVEKSNTINQLARSLEESQAQCQQLMASNVNCDNIRLQTLLDEAVQEKKGLEKALKAIQTECDLLKSDVAQYESLSKLTITNDNSSSDETDSIVRLGLSNKSVNRRSSNMHLTDMGSKLREELHRAVLNQKAKRMEIFKLQEALNAKDRQIQEMTNKEKLYLSQTEVLKANIATIKEQLKAQKERDDRKENTTDITSKEEIDRLNERISKLLREKQELESNKQELEAKNKELVNVIEELTQRIEAEKKKAVDDYSKEYLKFHDESVTRLRNEMEESSEKKIAECRSKLEETMTALDEVKKLYVEVTKAKEQLSRDLKSEKETRDALAKTKDNLEVKLNTITTIHEECARKMHSLRQENDELNCKLKSLQDTTIDSTPTLVKLKEENDELKQNIARMKVSHTDDLVKVRLELQTTRERLIELEKKLRAQLEVEINKVQSEKEELKRKFEEKESGLKRIIEAQKRRPILRDIGTETEANENTEQKSYEFAVQMNQIEAKHLKEIENLVTSHQNELRKITEDAEQMKENHRQILEEIQKRIIQEKEKIKTTHETALAMVEEKTKEMAVKFFTEEFRKMEAKFKDELERRPDEFVFEELKATLIQKAEEVNNLKKELNKNERVIELQQQIEEDREKMSEAMSHYAQKLEDLQVQLANKDKTIEELKRKVKQVRTAAKAYRDQLAESRNNLFAAQTRMEAVINEKKKEVDLRIEEIERQYEAKEKELRNKIFRKPHT